MEVPILALQAGDDKNIGAEVNAEFDEALTAAGVEQEIVTYPGAPHSFFDRRHDEFTDDSADAWNRTLEFIERYR
jgi:carboxymethylenebutenolidase